MGWVYRCVVSLCIHWTVMVLALNLKNLTDQHISAVLIII